MVDLRVYAILDPERAREPLDALARKVVAGGATLLQLRDKQGSTRRLVDEARAIKATIAGAGVPLLVNDRVDVALAAGADGVHLGQDDMAVEDARKLIGPRTIIGLSIKTVAQAQAAPLDKLDYVCVGGVFTTLSKHNPEPPIETSGLRAIVDVFRARAPGFPVGAIAGIDETNAAEVIAAGAEGVAVISALSLADDPQAATQRLRGIVDKALAQHLHPLAIGER